MIRAIESLKIIAAVCALVIAIGSVGAIDAGSVGLLRGTVQTCAGFAVFGALVCGGGEE